MQRIALLVLAFAPFSAPAAELPIFDAHLHYSHDAWEVVPPKQAIAMLRKAGVRRALVSSSGDDGQQRLAAEAPDLVVPELRPYRSRGDIGTWFRDETVPAYLEERLKRFRYAGIGEFHLYGADADLAGSAPYGRARETARPFSARAFGCRRGRAPVQAVAAGEDPLGPFGLRPARACARDAAQAQEPLVRSRVPDRPGAGGKVDADWRAAFLEFPDRFMVGTDSFTPERWHYIGEHANWSRGWLADLPGR